MFAPVDGLVRRRPGVGARSDGKRTDRKASFDAVAGFGNGAGDLPSLMPDILA
jgi:hypothetical protein